jgi:DNA-binding response OmpR family regulator
MLCAVPFVLGVNGLVRTEERGMNSGADPLGQPTAQPSGGPGRVRHVLVVEDEWSIRAMLAELLGHAGYAVIEAGDGREALRRLREQRPDLIVLDLMLPGMSGWEFLNQSREQRDRTHIPVVILSAIEGKADYPSTLGVAAWFTKPLDISRFLGAVEELAGAPPVSAQDDPSKRPHVLVIEDDDAVRRMLDEHFAQDGYDVETAETIAAGLERITSRPPDVILLDLMLPRQNGWTFLRQRQNNPALAAIPVLVISAAPQQRLLEAKHLGADGFLSKPFDLGVLNALVRSFAR